MYVYEELSEKEKASRTLAAVTCRKIRRLTYNSKILTLRLEDMNKYDSDYRRKHRDELEAKRRKIAEDCVRESDEYEGVFLRRQLKNDYDDYRKLEKRLLAEYDAHHLEEANDPVDHLAL